jgi:hypothetical protein
MGFKDAWGKGVKIFGFVFFAFNLIVFMVILTMMLYAIIRIPEYSPGIIVLAFPIIGMFAGRWMRVGQYGWWRSIIIVLSLLFSVSCLFIVFVIAPQMEKLKVEKFSGMQAVALDENTRKMFEGLYSDDVAVVKEQLDRGLSPDAVNETGQTALHVTQNKEMVRLLIEKGADVNAVDDVDMTPMFNKEVPLARLLVEAGADIHARSERGNTPLMWYAYSGYVEGIRYLISLGADVNAKNKDGQTAYDIAERFGHSELLDYLKSVGGKSGLENQ